ncbi:MAG: hypothetical protein AAF433_11020 [Bacteroidota bacterium]
MPLLHQATLQLLADGRAYLTSISTTQYQEPIGLLSNSSIGQHSRHWIEFFQCLLGQLKAQACEICYDDRSRDLLLESDPQAALAAIDQIEAQLGRVDLSQQLTLKAQVTQQSLELPSSLSREVWYAIEHAIHHLAIIKIGWRAVGNLPELPTDFGIAYSTRMHRQQLVEN